MLQTGIELRYIVAGDGPERQSLEYLARQMHLEDFVHFMGHVSLETKWSLMRQANLFVQPSRNDPKRDVEGFGIVYLEAAAFGVPSVATNVGGIPDAIIDWKTGLLVPPESPEELAKALLLLFQDEKLRGKMGQEAQQRVKDKFSARSVAMRFHESLLQLIGQ
jgi:phosphatidylinositol alpha-1,6-mannosyltransferase